MKYGLIAKRLTHSFSWEIHSMIGKYDYELCEIGEDKLGEFFDKREFLGINVTMPYKETVIPYLDFMDEAAKKIGAVNTVVNRDGKLYGYNTDFYGLNCLIEHIGISVSEKKVAILGTGGTSKTAEAVVRALGAKSVVKVSRSEKDGAISYEKFKEKYGDTEIIINTTPVGMYPKNYDTPLSLDGLNSLVGVVDVVYNPLRTPLVLQARERGIKAEGGLYMLVAQAVKAAEFFLNEEEKNSKEIIGRIYDTLSKEKENIVLIGMPSCGKSTIGELLAKELKIVHADTDGIILDSIDMSIKEYFEKYGEEHFRDLETSVTKDVAKCLGAVISTGGGVVLRKENVDALKQNGRIYFLDRPLEKLMPTSDRPTALSRDALHALYKERIDVYRRSADVIIDASGDPCDICNAIRGDFGI